jgi:hypothetical protein
LWPQDEDQDQSRALNQDRDRREGRDPNLGQGVVEAVGGEDQFDG